MISVSELPRRGEKLFSRTEMLSAPVSSAREQEHFGSSAAGKPLEDKAPCEARPATAPSRAAAGELGVRRDRRGQPWWCVVWCAVRPEAGSSTCTAHTIHPLFVMGRGRIAASMHQGAGCFLLLLLTQVWL